MTNMTFPFCDLMRSDAILKSACTMRHQSFSSFVFFFSPLRRLLLLLVITILLWGTECDHHCCVSEVREHGLLSVESVDAAPRRSD